MVCYQNDKYFQKLPKSLAFYAQYLPWFLRKEESPKYAEQSGKKEWISLAVF